MKRIKTLMSQLGLVAGAMVLVLISCKKYEVKSLVAKPVASFTVTPISGQPNRYLLSSTSSNAYRYDWDKATGSYSQGKQNDTVYFVFSGTYQIRLLAFGQSGMDSAKQTITVANSDPTACVGTPRGFITSCTSKKWRMDPDAGAYKVGPGPDDGSWWSNSAADVITRACEFNDEYTFSFNAAGTFVYDNKGDFYGDGYLGDNSHACQPTANYTAWQKPFGSGTFSYIFTPGAGQRGLGQLTVVGPGAHIGLQKVQNSGEVTGGPVANSITYDILAQTRVAAGNYDLLTLGVNLGWGWWTFRLRSF